MGSETVLINYDEKRKLCNEFSDDPVASVLGLDSVTNDTISGHVLTAIGFFDN